MDSFDQGVIVLCRSAGLEIPTFAARRITFSDDGQVW
jgi:hypothetical protein